MIINKIDNLTSANHHSCSRLLYLDGIRGLAALIVVVAHFNPWPWVLNQNSILSKIISFTHQFALGNLAVMFFFGLSAFILSRLVFVEYNKYQNISIWKFYIRRTLRIWPLYFLSVFTAYLLYCNPEFLPPSFSGSQIVFNWIKEHYLIFLTFTSSWSLALNGIFTHVDYSPGTLRILWSISVEEQFYFLFPIVSLIALRFKSARPFIISSIIIISIAFRYIFINTPVDNPEMKSSGGLYYHPLNYLDLFIFASVAGWLSALPNWRFVEFFKKNYLLYFIFPAMLCLAYWLGKVIWYPYSLALVFIMPFLALLISTLLLWAYYNPDACLVRFVSSKPFAILGRISFSIYIWHIISNSCVSFVFAKFMHGININLYFILTIISAICFGVISYLLIEKPFLIIKNSFRSIL